MNTLKLTLTTLIIMQVIIIASTPSAAQEGKAIGLTEKIRNARSANWREQYALIKQISKAGKDISEEEKEEFFLLFDDISSFPEKTKAAYRSEGMSYNESVNKYNDNYKEYRNFAVDASNYAAKLRDKRVVPGLLMAMSDYGPIISPATIVELGEVAIEPLLELTKSKDDNLRGSALFVLSLWVNAPIQMSDYGITEEQKISDKKSLNTIKAAFLRALNDESVGNKISAVYGLEAFPDNEVLQHLERVAREDKSYSETRNKLYGHYPVRNQAESSVKKLKLKIDQQK